jgi:hypothetical protein
MPTRCSAFKISYLTPVVKQLNEIYREANRSMEENPALNTEVLVPKSSKLQAASSKPASDPHFHCLLLVACNL